MYRQTTIAIVLVVGLLAPPASAQLTAQFLDEWGAFGPANGQFNEPYAVAVDTTGDVYVSDTVNYRIQKFDSDGNFILTWGSFGFGPGQFYDPVGLIVDDDGYVYVAEFTNDRVQKFDSNGTFQYMWGSRGVGPGQFRTADDVCLDASGRVFVADKNNHRVQKFENDGTYIKEWGSFGTNPGQFQYPVGIACDSQDNIYVAEQAGNRIQKFDKEGNFLRMWGTSGSGPGQFNEPIHMDMDASDRLFVPDSKNHRIQVFNTDGDYLGEWGSPGAGPGQFNEPEGVAVDDNDIVYVSDTQNHRIQKFRLIPGCPPCPPLPGANQALFAIGDAVALGGSNFEVSLLASTPESINFSQMTVEYDDTCLSFVGATVGSDVANPGSIFINEGSGATDPTLNHHVLLNVTGEYGAGCDLEVFVLSFQSLTGGTPPCRIVWDRDVPAGNPPNHLNTTGSVQIRYPAITFCDSQGPVLRTIFRFGDPIPQANCYEVPLLVTTDESINFSQMTVEYSSSCLVFQSATIGSGVANPGTPFVNDAGGATNVPLDRHVLLNATGEYGPGVDVEVFRVCFQFAGGAQLPCRLAWDESAPPGNPPNHLLTTVPSQIPPGWIQFIEGELSATCDDIDVSGAVTYCSNGCPILPSVPDPACVAVTVEHWPNPTPTTLAVNGTYSLGFGNGPFAEIWLDAHRPKTSCTSFEGGVISGSDLIILQDFVAQIGPPPTPRQLLAGDLNRDGLLLANDELALKQWIGWANVCTSDRCLGQPTDNCAGTWQFIFPTGPGPGDFDVDRRCLYNVCADQAVPVEGILLGDVDASWPNIFPIATAGGTSSKPAYVPLSLSVAGWDDDVVTLSLTAKPDAGAELHHVIYTLDYDAAVFEYLDCRTGDGNRGWGTFENASAPGVVHGIVHRRAGMQPLEGPGEVAQFRFRARNSQRDARFSFSRLLANDLDVGRVSLETGAGGREDSAVRARYQLLVHPNPFNPSTYVRFTIPEGAAVGPVRLRVYDISGRLVRTLLEGERGPGVHETLWNGTDDRDTPVGTGIYLVRAQAGEWTDVRRVALIK